MTYSPALRLLEDDVFAGLAARRKHLPWRLLHDVESTALFDRVETELLVENLPQIAQNVGADARVIEPGSGDGSKTRRLLHGLERPSSYVTIDLSRDRLARSTAALRADLPSIDVQGLVADYTHPFVVPTPQHAWKTTLVFFPGSTIGNFEPSDARRFLSMLARIAGDDGMLLIGADGTRDATTLLRAYDDPSGATAELHKNVLRRLNRERGTNFDLDRFEYRVVWNAEASRVEMHLVSTCRQLVHLDGHTFNFASEEAIVTEDCYKHSPMAMQAMLGSAGWRPRQVFTSAHQPYRLWLCEPLRWSR